VNCPSGSDLSAVNLEATYLAIASGIPDTRITVGAGFVAAANDFPHPICNFGLCRQEHSFDVHELMRLARRRSYFNIYVSRANGETIGAPFSGSGYERVYTLLQMEQCDDAPVPDIECLVAEAMGSAERRSVAEFMAEQFFAAQSQGVRSRISSATNSAESLKLFELRNVEKLEELLGAVMLHNTEGRLGLYNLCVAAPHRAKGHGSNIVNWVRRLAKKQNLAIVLQCDPRLQAWYERLNFRASGSVDVYALVNSA
jgi:GNAT superfamily N-acetyltransferase